MSIRIYREWAALAVFLGAGIGVLAWGRNGGLPTGQTAEKVHPRAVDALPGILPVERRSLAFYAQGIPGALFGTPVPPAPPVKAAREKVVPVAHSTASNPSPEPDPLEDYVFTGIITCNGQTFALVENRKTREDFYLKEGDTFQGFTIAQIDRTGLTVKVGETARMLARNDNYSLTPLDKNGVPAGNIPANGDIPTQVVEAEKESLVAQLRYADARLTLLGALRGGVDVEQIHNDVFEGKMTQEEADRIIGNSGSVVRLYEARFTRTLLLRAIDQKVQESALKARRFEE